MISIIIIVKNDMRIEKTLVKISQIYKPEKTEIIVVDASEGKLDYIREKFPKIRWIYFHNKTNKKITIPEQRNLGLKKAKGDIIVFIDADCIPQKEWLVRLIKAIREENESIVAGYIEVKDYMTLELPKEKYIEHCGNANLAFKREVIKKIGYYDENLEVAEDYDFCFRARKAGYKIRFFRGAIVFHSKENFVKNIKKGFVYGKGAIKLYRKHPNNIKLNSHFIFMLFYAGYILFLPITFFFHYYPLLIMLPIIINIKRNPIKEIVNLSYGLGVLKELFFPKKNETHPN